ncbi:9204_t:CDS:2 [Funneliformis geosporum]|nr:9204_t:CDS:2 [Funneliformis geosporum]
MDASQISARLFNIIPNFNHKFILIIANDRIQFACEVYIFQFFATLGDIKTVFNGVSKWTADWMDFMTR